jgi:predicted Zn-dependent protease
VKAAVFVLGLACVTGCSGGTDRWKEIVPDRVWPSSRGEKATLVSELKSGAYEPSSLAIGEEKDLARQRAEGFGLVRQARLEGYLAETRATLLAVSGKTGVPGRVSILASPSFSAHSTPDGNVFVSMGCLEDLESADEVAAVLAHEISHVLLGHHSADLFADLQHRGRAIYKLWIDAKTSANRRRTPTKGDGKGLDAAETVVRVTDKLVLPAWNRGQEREADFLGVDLLVEAGYSPVAMIGMLEKLRASEQTDEEADKAFLARLQQSGNQSLRDKANELYKELLGRISINHPKTDERIQQTASYLERHYGERKLAEPRSAPWKSLIARPGVREVMTNYRLAFSAHSMLEKGNKQEAYASARKAVSGATLGAAYPNVILARAARAVDRQPEAISALDRAAASPEPVSLVYVEQISMYERDGNLSVALAWVDKASQAFGGAPQWTPHRIRLLRKAGRTVEASAAAAECGLKTPDWKSLCDQANRT